MRFADERTEVVTPYIPFYTTTESPYTSSNPCESSRNHIIWDLPHQFPKLDPVDGLVNNY